MDGKNRIEKIISLHNAICEHLKMDLDKAQLTRNSPVDIYEISIHLKMTYDELKTLLSENYSKPEIDAVLDDLENYRQNTKYKSMVKTARNWLKKRKTNIVQPVQTFNSYKLGPEYDN